MILIDVFIADGEIVKWYKEGRKDIFVKDTFSPAISLSTFNEGFARKILSGLQIEKCRMKELVKGELDVLRITFPSITEFRKRFREIERRLENVGTFYNADIPLEEMYLFEHGIYPLMGEQDDITRYDYTIPDFRIMRIKFTKEGILVNNASVSVNEVISEYKALDPDILFVNGQQKELLEFCRKHALKLNRWGEDSFPTIKGNSYFSYGQSYYRETPVYLKGRLLLNGASFMNDEFTITSILEGARICRMRIQRTASHSVGAAVTNLLTYTAYKDGYLIPYKVGVYEKIKPFRELVACDRGAFTLEPFTGVHRHVAELDFVSMYPSIIARWNLSPETLSCGCCSEKIPGTEYHFCTKRKGIVPKVCEYLIDRRQHFKQRKDYVSEAKTGFLKWLLVVIFGFQSFRAKKIGCIEVHESINAVARMVLHKTIRIAEEEGFTVVHGIVDSLYVKKTGMTREDLLNLAEKITAATGLTIELKKTYRFMTFLPSVNASYMPVPTAYYGVAYDGEVKVRGIELRTRNSPAVVKSLQEEVIEKMGKTDEGRLFEEAVRILRNHLAALEHATAEELALTVRLGREDYKVNCAQKRVLLALKKRGVTLVSGQSIKYVIVEGNYVPLDAYRGTFDRGKYSLLMKKAVLRLFLAEGITREDLERELAGQRRIEEWAEPLSAEISSR